MKRGSRAIRLAVAASAFALASGAAACGGGEVPREVLGVPHAQLVKVVIGGQPAAVLVPDRFAARRPMVLWLHGVNAGEEAPRLERPVGFTRQLVRHGVLVASSRAHGDAWGSRASLSDYRRLTRWVRRHYRTGPVLLLAESMGGLPALQLLAEHGVPGAVALAGISPVTNLRSMRDQDLYAGSVRASGSTTDPSATPAKAFSGAHLRFYVSRDDDFVPPGANAYSLASRLAPVVDVTIRRCSGGHLAASCWQASDVLAWFARLEGSYSQRQRLKKSTRSLGW